MSHAKCDDFAPLDRTREKETLPHVVADVGKRRAPAVTRLARHSSGLPAFANTGCYGGVALDLEYLNLRVGKRTHVKRDALAIVIIYGDTPTVFLPGNDPTLTKLVVVGSPSTRCKNANG